MMDQIDFSSYQWDNESSFTVQDEKLIIAATPKSDYFCATEDGNHAVTATAPFLHTDVTGDFAARVKMFNNYVDCYDSCVLMVLQDETHWAKACFERTDFGKFAVVSVVTNENSDDANGCNIDAEAVWLQIARQGNNFAIHYSLDGENFEMMRYFHLPLNATVKVGLAAQAPVGPGGERAFAEFSLKCGTPADLRGGK